MKRLPHLFGISCLSILMAACGSNDSQEDLIEFIDENKKRAPGVVKEPPKIATYEAFTYDAYQLRSPFEQPIVIISESIVAPSSNVKPDLIRQKERLEQYDIANLEMVGTLERNGVLWALISDPDGGIERVREGNYVGRNYGKISNITQDKIDIVEIVASGEAWLERPNLLQIRSSDG